jgi:uncharacterized membrane protein (DUF2068 family)
VEPSRGRPVGVAIISLFLVVDTVASLLEIFVDLPFYTRAAVIRDAEGPVLAVLLTLALLRIVAAVGLWRGSRRAWVLTMLLVGIALVIYLGAWWNGEPNMLRLAVNAVIAFYLNQSAVREHCAGPRRVTA